VFAPTHAISNPGQSQRQRDADMTGQVKRRLVLETDTDRECNRSCNQDVKGNDDVGEYRTNGGNEVGH
jgi:hypothetical protein